MSGGHHDAHSAGPIGITLNELHVARPELSTEMFSLGSMFSVDSALGKETEPQTDPWHKRISHAVVVLLASALLSGASYGVSCFAVSWLALQAGLQSLGLPETLASIFCAILSVLLASVPVLLGLLAADGLGITVKYEIKSAADKEKAEKKKKAEKHQRSFKDLVKATPDLVHFGHLQLNYSINDHAIVDRSLSDRLVSVIGKSMIKSVEIGSSKEAQRWRGRLLTPPVIVTLEKAGYESRLFIHGAHFETPGLPLEDAEKRAADFCEAIRKLKSASGGSSGHH